jgi:hypothetical protein
MGDSFLNYCVGDDLHQNNGTIISLLRKILLRIRRWENYASLKDIKTLSTEMSIEFTGWVCLTTRSMSATGEPALMAQAAKYSAGVIQRGQSTSFGV